MKLQVLSAVLSVGLAGSILAQGSVYFDTSENTSTSPLAQSNGEWFMVHEYGPPTLLTQDVNAVLYGCVVPNGPFTPLATLLLSNGSAKGDITFFADAGSPGLFMAPNDIPYVVPGAVTSAYFYIEAWTGDYGSYDTALSYGAPCGRTGVFESALAMPPTPPPGLDGAPAVLIFETPEPGAFSLAVLGAALLLSFRRRK